MKGKELNIKSSTIEKGLELAKEFLGKLISPTVEEVGLLISDNVKYLRFKNQVKILVKAKEYVEKHNISIKEIPIKILVPLLDKASLDENEELQDKWAKMLVNLVNSEKNFQNQIFPYLLSQIALEEFNELMSLLEKEKQHLKNYVEAKRIASHVNKYSLSPENRKLKEDVEKIEQEGFFLSLDEFELANLSRLGLIRQLPPRIFIQEFKTGGNQLGSHEEWHSLDAEYDTNNSGYRITALGAKFIQICELEQEKASH